MSVQGTAPAPGGNASSQGAAGNVTTQTASGAQTGAAGATAPPADWRAGLNDDLKGFAELKQFSDPGQILDSYRNLEKLMGAPKERLLKLPEKADDPAWNDIYTRLGKPQKPEEYQIAAPEGEDDSFAKAVSKTFHEANLSRSQADKLSKWWGEYVQNANQTQETAQKTQLDAETLALKKEWGSAYNQNLEMAKSAMKTFGIKPETVDKIEQMVGYRDVMTLMQQIGSRLGEPNFHTGGKSGSGNFGNILTPVAAQARIRALQGDMDFVRRLSAGGANEMQEWTQLHQWAFPDTSEDQSA